MKLDCYCLFCDESYGDILFWFTYYDRTIVWTLFYPYIIPVICTSNREEKLTGSTRPGKSIFCLHWSQAEVPSGNETVILSTRPLYDRAGFIIFPERRALAQLLISRSMTDDCHEMPLALEVQRITLDTWPLFQDGNGRVLDEYSARKWMFYEVNT